MIGYDQDMITRAIERRSSEQRWRPDLTLIVSRICAWQMEHPEDLIEYEGGRPGPVMRTMIEDVSPGTAMQHRHVLSSFGAAHCLLCDTVPVFRPVLLSRWDRDDASPQKRHRDR